MSICINNDLIWISVPRCASFSIEESIENQLNLNYQHIKNVNPDFEDIKDRHIHVPLIELKKTFGNLETVRITRNWFDRWLSAIEYVWKSIEIYNLTPKVKYEDLTNEYIYNVFTDTFLNDLFIINEDIEIMKKLYNSLVIDDLDLIDNKNFYSVLRILCPQNFWTNNEKCTYEFDIKEIDKFEKFISNRYNIIFKVSHINKSKKIKNNIIINDELKKFVWDKFESRYIKNKTLI